MWEQRDDGSWKKSSEFKVSYRMLFSSPISHFSSSLHYIFLQAHQGTIWRLSWAHPEFGQALLLLSIHHSPNTRMHTHLESVLTALTKILGCCSFDCLVSVWEDDVLSDKWANITTTLDIYPANCTYFLAYKLLTPSR
jgi:hypothetical protein